MNNKFNYEMFTDDTFESILVANAKKYSKEDLLPLAIQEFENEKLTFKELSIEKRYMRYYPKYPKDECEYWDIYPEDNSGGYLFCEKGKGSFPVWAITVNEENDHRQPVW